MQIIINLVTHKMQLKVGHSALQLVVSRLVPLGMSKGRQTITLMGHRWQIN